MKGPRVFRSVLSRIPPMKILPHFGSQPSGGNRLNLGPTHVNFAMLESESPEGSWEAFPFEAWKKRRGCWWLTIDVKHVKSDGLQSRLRRLVEVVAAHDDLEL